MQAYKALSLSITNPLLAKMLRDLLFSELVVGDTISVDLEFNTQQDDYFKGSGEQGRIETARDVLLALPKVLGLLEAELGWDAPAYFTEEDGELPAQMPTLEELARKKIKSGLKNLASACARTEWFERTFDPKTCARFYELIIEGSGAPRIRTHIIDDYSHLGGPESIDDLAYLSMEEALDYPFD